MFYDPYGHVPQDPLERILFWISFLAVWFHTSESWAAILNQVIREAAQPQDILRIAILLLVTFHLKRK